MTDMREIPGFPGYQASDCGRIWSKKNKMFLKPGGTHYLTVTLSHASELTYINVHRLVAMAFLGDPGFLCVRHRNGDHRDNRPENLEYGSYKENAEDRDRHGRTSRGERHHPAKLSEQQVIEILEKAKTVPVAHLSKEYGVTACSVRKILRNKTWKHIGRTTPEQSENPSRKAFQSESDPTCSRRGIDRCKGPGPVGSTCQPA